MAPRLGTAVLVWAYLRFILMSVCLFVYLSICLFPWLPAYLSVFLPSFPTSPSSLFTSNTWQCNLETRCSFQRLTFSFPPFPGQDSTKGRPLFVPHFETLCQSEYAAVCPFARGTKKAVSNLHLLVSLPFSSSLCMCDFRCEMRVCVHAAPSGNHLHPLRLPSFIIPQYICTMLGCAPEKPQTIIWDDCLTENN